jgi:predicted phage-related endonuclease
MLTHVQLDARKGKLTASRIACLMTGDAPKIMDIYLEMIGEKLRDDLSHVWPVRLGIATESLQLDWYEERSASTVSRRGDVVVHNRHDWAACTLDGWDEILNCPVEVKHVGGREPLEVVIDRYQPQLQWQMEVTGATQCVLSVIMGANVPIVEYIDRDADYAAEMVKRGAQFMACVAARCVPVVLEPLPAPADASRIYDMSRNNSWGSEAFIWRENKPAADRCRDAEKILKALVPDDAKKCHGYNIQITRDRAGRLSLRETP